MYYSVAALMLIVKLLSKRRLLLATKANPSSSMKDLVSTSFDVEIVKAVTLFELRASINVCNNYSKIKVTTIN